MGSLAGQLALIALALLILSLALLLVYVRWFARKIALDLPYIEIETLPGSEEGATRVRLTLRATSRKFNLVRLRAEGEDVQRLGITFPDGFVLEEDHEVGEAVESWIPTKSLTLKPREPVELEFRYAVSGEAPASVRGWAEAGLGLGGTIVPFSLAVGDRDPLEIELSNRRSRLYARAREQGVTPRELAEFEEVRALEARLEGAKRDSSRG